MKYYFLLIIAMCTFSVRAQVVPPPNQQPFQTNYGIMQFNTPFYGLDNHWAVAVKNEQTGKYIFGMVYLDMAGGFSFRIEGTFGVDAQGHVFRDSTDYPKNNLLTLRISAGTKILCAIPDAMLADLHVKPIPDWLATYHPANQDRNSVAFKVTYGKFLNGAGAPAKALEYLEDAYKTQPHAPGLEFELSYAYNVLTRYNEAITMLKAAIANAPDIPSLYVELGFGYMQSKDFDNAVKTYIKGIALAKQQNNGVARMSMTNNLSLLYSQLQQNDKAVALLNEYIADVPNSVANYILLATIYLKANDMDNVIKSYAKAIDVTNPQDMETKAGLAWSIALLYRDRVKDNDQYITWGKKAKEWAPVNGRVAATLRGVNF